MSQTDESIEYGKKYMLQHMIDGGLSLDEIADKLNELPEDNPHRAHFAQQFLERVPPEEHEKYAEKLNIKQA